jgi:oligoribonuclease (3'-5' exoribonuclease)
MNSATPNLSKFLIITSAAKLGIMESVFNVQLIIISTLMEFAVKLNPNVKTSTDKSEFVKPAIKDMVLSTESVLELT